MSVHYPAKKSNKKNDTRKDKRKRDLDNIRKCVYDSLSDRTADGSLVHRGIMADDCMIKHDEGFMYHQEPGNKKGYLIVTIEEIKWS